MGGVVIGRLIRCLAARVLGPESVYPDAAIRAVNAAVEEHGRMHPPMAAVHNYRTEENDGPERKAA